IYDKVAEVKASYGLTLLAFDVSFPLAAQSDALLPNTISSVLVAGACMLLTTVLFVPGLRASMLLMWTLVSINAGVFALLAAWDTRLDIISSITILLSIGYSIDF
uniref:Uncharacterized protein n=1 Tax=Plectus sambesii TaxID=2011161 RepID=A0A914VNI4_9BILA